MSGLSYSRTSGTLILPDTWAAVQARYPGQVIAPHERLSWDEASDVERKLMLQHAMTQKLEPPPFLRFDLADAAGPALAHYPGATPSAQGHKAGGKLWNELPEVAANRLGITRDRLDNELKKFSGPVTLAELAAGTKIYRTVGLTAKSARYGSVTNKLLGDYWEDAPPDTHSSIEAWRAATAVKAEWNGDYGYLEITLPNAVLALTGMTGMQAVDTVRDLVLPGGGVQIFIPDLAAAAPKLAAEIAAKDLVDLIQETRFQGSNP